MTTSQFDVRTGAHDQMVDITARVADLVRDSGVREGTATIFIPHTTAAVTINENADPDVVHDVQAAMSKAFPWQEEFYRHGEGNSAAHVKSSLVGCSVTVPIAEGRMLLGTWQAIYFCEFDGPRSRRAIVTVQGA